MKVKWYMFCLAQLCIIQLSFVLLIYVAFQIYILDKKLVDIPLFAKQTDLNEETFNSSIKLAPDETQIGDLEVIKSCTSVNNLFLLLKNGHARHDNHITSIKTEGIEFNEYERKLLHVLNESEDILKESDDEYSDTESEEEESDVEEEEIEEDDDKPNDDNDSASLVYLFVCALLLLSMGFSLIEFWRERNQKKAADDSHDAMTSENHSSTRRMSIADLTIIRHARKESQHRDSVTNCSTGHSQLMRRSSFPVLIPDFAASRTRVIPKRQQTWSPPGSIVNMRRMSVDINDDDVSPDRRRVRIIRRH